MRCLGIDFGSKRVGIAMSDEQGGFAMPYSVLKNDKKLVENILNIVEKENILKIIVGESLNEKNEPNVIMESINSFKFKLEEELEKKQLEKIGSDKNKIEVVFEREYFSSQHAEFFQGKHDLLDSGAAALILQRYLDKNKN